MNKELPSLEDCVDAGRYYFGVGDFEAARTWWQKALGLDPANHKIREYLALLERNSMPPSKPLPAVPLPEASHQLAPPEAWGDSSKPSEPSAPRPAVTDPLDFAMDSGPPQNVAVDYASFDAWDFGPAEISSVTLEPIKDAVDAVAEPAPLPRLDREPVFQVAQPSRPILGTASSATHEPVGAHARSADPTEEVLTRARHRFRLSDFEGALELLEHLELGPGHPDFDETRRLLVETRNHLERSFAAKLGDLDRVPRVVLPEDQLIWLSLNHRASFILSQIDGSVSYEDLMALSGMPRLDTLRILAALVQEGVISP